MEKTIALRFVNVNFLKKTIALRFENVKFETNFAQPWVFGLPDCTYVQYFAYYVYRTSGVIFFIDYCTAIRDT